MTVTRATVDSDLFLPAFLASVIVGALTFLVGFMGLVVSLGMLLLQLRQHRFRKELDEPISVLFLQRLYAQMASAILRSTYRASGNFFVRNRLWPTGSTARWDKKRYEDSKRIVHNRFAVLRGALGRGEVSSPPISDAMDGGGRFGAETKRQR